MTDRQKEILARISEQHRVRRHVTLYQCVDGMETMTFGFLRPAIVCDRETESWENEPLLCHEMVHISRWNTLWKVLMQSAALLHWWNPMV